MKVDLERYLQELETIVNMDSGQGNPEGITAVGDFFADRFEKMGWIVEKYDLRPNTGNCTVIKNREADHYDVLLIGHVDTVFETGETAKRPFRRDEKNCYGVGVIDMKQGCLSMLHIMEALPKEVNEKLNILVIYNPDEEIGSIWSLPILQKYASISSKVFVFEAGGHGGEVTIERKGSTKLSVTIHGKAGHAGYMFTNGSLSAVTEAVHWVNTLAAFHSEEQDTTVNVGVFQAGEKVNVVAPTAHVEWGIRYFKKEIKDQVVQCVEELMEHAKQGGYTVEVHAFQTKPALEPDEKTFAYVERMKAVAEKMGRPFGLKKRGGLSDANHMAACGPVCVDSLGPTGDFDHSDREYLAIDTIEPYTQFAYELICDLANE